MINNSDINKEFSKSKETADILKRISKSKNIVLPILVPQGENKNTYTDRNSKLIET
jgi:hypothetical protein